VYRLDPVRQRGASGYTYQPRLEKRVNQFKSIHHAAPSLFKRVSRIEAHCFVFFIALIIQALVEREVRMPMHRDGINALPIYPEPRDAERPTTSKISDVFEPVSTYSNIENHKVVETFQDKLSDTQKTILKYLTIREPGFWVSNRKNE